MTIAEARQVGAKLLHPYSDAPDIDAQWLLMKALGLEEASYLLAHSDQELSEKKYDTFNRLVEERTTGKPLAYLLGWAEFYGRRFAVNEHVLIPRPATEDLVAQALPLIKTLAQKLGRSLHVADIGTGSGCIAITLALESPCIDKIYATDISPEALAVAKKNAEGYGVEKRIECLLGDMLAPLAGISIDFIVSNPPYVPSRELSSPPTKQTRGLAFEPQAALDGGNDGQLYVTQIERSNIPAIIETVGGTIRLLNIRWNTKTTLIYKRGS